MLNTNKTPLILFVCTGNQIRSPLAAAIFQQRLIEAGLQGVLRVDSAGTWTHPGRSEPKARETARRMGLDIEGHRSKIVNQNILLEACLVIVMENGQKEALEVEYPRVRGKVRLLSQLAGEHPYNVPDPAGQEMKAFLQTGEELLKLVNKAFEQICYFVQERRF